MRVGIMTFPNSPSYGATMQMYALYRAVESLGAQAEIINYHDPYMKAEKHIVSRRGKSGLHRSVRLALKHLVHYRQVFSFRRFEKTMQLYPKKAIDKTERLKRLENRYDAAICGSDQVWNPLITNADRSYYLNFCGEKTKRISYAPSFGNVSYSKHMQEPILQELQQFHRISVREHEGQGFLQQLTGKQYPVVLDPTFLLDRAAWEQIEKPYKVSAEGYILYYVVRSSSKLLDFCLDLAEKSNRKVVIAGGNIWKKIRSKDERILYAPDLDPREWLYLIHHADCVVTNSFHGTAFAMHYQKDFYVEFSSDTNSRLEEIICTTDLHDRVVDYKSPVWQDSINYDEVNARLAEPRKQSLSFLRAAIQ